MLAVLAPTSLVRLRSLMDLGGSRACLGIFQFFGAIALGLSEFLAMGGMIVSEKSL